MGVFVSDKLAMGIELDLLALRSKEGADKESIVKESTIGFSPFVRYYALNWNKFSVYGQGNIGVAFSKSKEEYGSDVYNGPKETEFYIRFHPGLSYDISDKFSLETSINLLSIGFNHSVIKDDDDDYRENISNFNLGAGLDDIVTIGAIKIGAIYKF